VWCDYSVLTFVRQSLLTVLFITVFSYSYYGYTLAMQRKIIHIDADCFFAAIEIRDDPCLSGLPVAVGGDISRRGVIATCNYEARRFGVHSAMSSHHAKRLCPQLIIVPSRMAAYREASQAMREIFSDYTDLVEPLSLDEAYLDVSDSSGCQGSATLMAAEIRLRVEQALRITVSAGVAPNKFLAKVASDWQKPNGLTVIPPSRVETFVPPLAVTRIHGVGKVTAQKLHRAGIETCADLRQRSIFELTQLFGTFGARLYDLSYGVDERAVVASRRRKSVSVEHTYGEDLPSLAACLAKIPELYEQLQGRLDNLDESYRVNKAFVKIKFSDFSTTTLERLSPKALICHYRELLKEAFVRGARPVRLLGLGVRFVNLESNSNFFQLSLFNDNEKTYHT